jgi:hypothetical protein
MLKCFSSVYFRTSLTTVLPKPRLLPGWMVPIHPFSHSMWVAVGLSVVVSTVALQAASRASMRMLGEYLAGYCKHTVIYLLNQRC